MEPGLYVMQDNAPPHKSGQTVREFERRRISLPKWPAISPDLNPIQNEWSYMKDFMELHFPLLDQERQHSSIQLHFIVSDAWDLVLI